MQLTLHLGKEFVAGEFLDDKIVDNPITTSFFICQPQGCGKIISDDNRIGKFYRAGDTADYLSKLGFSLAPLGGFTAEVVDFAIDPSLVGVRFKIKATHNFQIYLIGASMNCFNNS